MLKEVLIYNYKIDKRNQKIKTKRLNKDYLDMLIIF